MMEPGSELGDGEAIMPVLKSPRKGLGFFSLLVVAFFWVSGGIYGNEALLAYAPPGYAYSRNPRMSALHTRARGVKLVRF